MSQGNHVHQEEKTWGTLLVPNYVVLMECGKIPQVPLCHLKFLEHSQKGAVNPQLLQGLPIWHWRCHRACPKQTLKGLKRLWQKWKLTIAPNQKKTCKYHRETTHPGKINTNFDQAMCPIMWFICVCSMCSMQKMDHNSWGSSQLALFLSAIPAPNN